MAEGSVNLERAAENDARMLAKHIRQAPEDWERIEQLCKRALEAIARRALRPAEDAQCECCQGNGEIVTDWDRYLHAHDGDQGDEAVAECPDCNGTGRVPAEDAQAVAWRGDADDGTIRFTAIKRVSEIWADQGLAITALAKVSDITPSPISETPQAPEITEEMVERATEAIWNEHLFHVDALVYGDKMITPDVKMAGAIAQIALAALKGQ